ncbi:beta-N-acetylhexosaminidase [Lysinibacter sp. HNR]|uniref:beta-N-acetylhexosaminidase n=1 Tax=Lysinibacter sp. HNR TaxID=3031408 RepID=UPI002435A113|nr:beta-N-acetylhexosaminidase [Lysinibacter sp. HNR]WGD38017.1 beta-N-acetylhexosaminidase [Lysinibacter sp. HNR]
MSNIQDSAEDGTLQRRIAGTMLPGFEGVELPAWVERRLREGMGGVCLFATNIGTPDQLRSLTAAIRRANPNAVIAIDEEGGDVTRLHHSTGSPFPGNAVLGRINDLQLTHDIAYRVGQELRVAGCTVTFAPDVDINSNPDNPVIGTRSFGVATDLVSAHSHAWVRGVQRAGIAASAKHFPGHGDTAQDSHLALPVIDRSLAQLHERELKPFRAAIEAGTQTIMTSHILLPQIDRDTPATFSSRILQGILREELGFEGVIVTDALDMAGASATTGIPEAAVRALVAGCDLLCIGTANSDEQMGEILDHVTEALRAGRLDATRLAEATRRLEALSRWGDSVLSEQDPEPVTVDTAAIINSFEVRDDVTLPRILDGGQRVHVVVCEGVPNIAVGPLPWGPQAELEALRATGSHPWPHLTLYTVWAREELPSFAEIGREDTVIVVGQNNHRHETNRAVIEGLRATRQNTLVVEMGWPSADRSYADVATFGASRLVGRALVEMLRGDNLP